MKVVGINGMNIRAGGGLHHLLGLLGSAEPMRQGIDRVVLWIGPKGTKRIPKQSWLEVVEVPAFDGSLLTRAIWHYRHFAADARKRRCEVVLSPAGVGMAPFRPFVAMSQNMLPFEPEERARFGLRPPRVRYHMLERTQGRTFKQADGVIFLTEYARDTIIARLGGLEGRTTVVPHGVDERFTCKPRPQRPFESFTVERPFKVLYTSIVNFYKHQWHVVDAIRCLREEGMPIELDLVGPAYDPALERLETVMSSVPPQDGFIRYHGAVPHDRLSAFYHDADAFLFASSCENLPIIMLEAMRAGLPILSAHRGPMPEVLADAGLYFDPESPTSIAGVLRTLVKDNDLRSRLATQAFVRSQVFTWKRCADETFSFLASFT